MRLASRSPSGKPVSNSSDSPVGETNSVEAPPSTSIQVIFRSRDWAVTAAPAVSVNAAMAAAERRKRCMVSSLVPALTIREALFAREASTNCSKQQIVRARRTLGSRRAPATADRSPPASLALPNCGRLSRRSSSHYGQLPRIRPRRIITAPEAPAHRRSPRRMARCVQASRCGVTQVAQFGGCMRQNATFFCVALAWLWSVAAFAQGAANHPAQGAVNPSYAPPAWDTYTPNIPGVVAGGTTVELITDQLNGTEGPVAMPDGTLLFTEGGARRLSRFDKDGKRSTFLENIQSGGLGFDPKGRLIANDNTPGKQGIYIVYPKGAERTLIDRKTPGFMQSNDIVVDKKGGVYFTQPEQANVGYIFPDGKGTKIVAEHITRPNGITMSPDEKILYVNDSRGEYLLA